MQITLVQEGRRSKEPSLVGNDKIREGDGGAKAVGRGMAVAPGPGTVGILNFDCENDL